MLCWRDAVKSGVQGMEWSKSMELIPPSVWSKYYLEGIGDLRCRAGAVSRAFGGTLDAEACRRYEAAEFGAKVVNDMSCSVDSLFA